MDFRRRESTIDTLAAGGLEEPFGSVGLRSEVGGTHYRGSSQTTAASATTAVVVGVGLPLNGQSHLSASVSPGIGVGRIALVDGIHSGTRRTLGAALAWTHSSGVAVNLGMQRIVIAGGPTQMGFVAGVTSKPPMRMDSGGRSRKPGGSLHCLFFHNEP